MDKGKEVKNPNPGSPVKDMPRTSMMEKAEVNDPPRKGIIRMIAGSPPLEIHKRLERPKYEKVMEPR
ncbi:UNVERIFIED_CONTAM: hypothetical protein Slati_4206400 [Sesamum latifolium]|uniref:Uncharacterized protein n=1 Tax=Sesamum latifolium TaxID=2727402 RepID=A0AAW2TAJ8_9LAMI